MKNSAEKGVQPYPSGNSGFITILLSKKGGTGIIWRNIFSNEMDNRVEKVAGEQRLRPGDT